MTNVDLLVLLFKALRGVTPLEVVQALRRWLQEEWIPHNQRVHDETNVQRARNLLAVLPDWKET